MTAAILMRGNNKMEDDDQAMPCIRRVTMAPISK